MKRSLEQITQSAFNRHFYDELKLFPEILNSSDNYKNTILDFDTLIIESIKTYRKHNKSNNDYKKTEISRKKRCNGTIN